MNPEILVIPDVHLNIEQVKKARRIIDKYSCRGIFLGDILDDYGREYDLELYRKTISEVEHFTKDYPDTVFLLGNHELAYLERSGQCSGNIVDYYYSSVKYLLTRFAETVKPKIIYKSNEIVFSHAGISDVLVKRIEIEKGVKLTSVSQVIDEINSWSYEALTYKYSPLWNRPFYGDYYNCFQVVGHTPVKEVTLSNSVWHTDCFSGKTSRKHFLLINDETKYARLIDPDTLEVVKSVSNTDNWRFAD